MMSGPLRKLVGPTKLHLHRYTETANDLLEKKLNELELDEMESETEDFINRMSSNITILDKNWSTLLKETKGDVRVTEEQEYTCVVEGEGGFIELMLIVNEVMARQKARTTLILRKRD